MPASAVAGDVRPESSNTSNRAIMPGCPLQAGNLLACDDRAEDSRNDLVSRKKLVYAAAGIVQQASVESRSKKAFIQPLVVCNCAI
jgi:hypothetical protein